MQTCQTQASPLSLLKALGKTGTHWRQRHSETAYDERLKPVTQTVRGHGRVSAVAPSFRFNHRPPGHCGEHLTTLVHSSLPAAPPGDCHPQSWETNLREVTDTSKLLPEIQAQTSIKLLRDATYLRPEDQKELPMRHRSWTEWMILNTIASAISDMCWPPSYQPIPPLTPNESPCPLARTRNYYFCSQESWSGPPQLC